jgi:hypothetical protein
MKVYTREYLYIVKMKPSNTHLIPYQCDSTSTRQPEQLYSEYRSKKYPSSTSYFLEHQKFQANYASFVISMALLTGYFQLLDNQLSGYGLIVFIILVYMIVNMVTYFLMDTVFVRIVINPVGLTANTLSNVLSSSAPDRALRIMGLKMDSDAVQISTDDRLIILKRADWPKFDELLDDLKVAHENGFTEKYKVFR